MPCVLAKIFMIKLLSKFWLHRLPNLLVLQFMIGTGLTSRRPDSNDEPYVNPMLSPGAAYRVSVAGKTADSPEYVATPWSNRVETSKNCFILFALISWLTLWLRTPLEIWGSIPWLVKSNAGSPTARHRFDISSKLCYPGAALRRLVLYSLRASA